METAAGQIVLVCNLNAPRTVQHMLQLIKDGLYDGTCYYRSDFVIQCGLMNFASGEPVPNPRKDLTVNETSSCGMSNVRGSCAVAHWDVPDCGNSDWFINLQANAHLDQACVHPFFHYSIADAGPHNHPIHAPPCPSGTADIVVGLQWPRRPPLLRLTASLPPLLQERKCSSTRSSSHDRDPANETGKLMRGFSRDCILVNL